MCDRYSHLVLAVRAQPDQQFGRTLRTFRALMRQAGLPEIIRVDHGLPFASVGLGRLSALSVWWIEQGIEVEFTRPASPQDNGSHERMHKDLKAEATQPPSVNLAAQQRRFERWQYTYNHERPHESLDRQRPGEVYQPSARRLNENDKPTVYASEFEVKAVSASGHVAHEGRNYHVGEAFAGKRVGLRRTADGQTELHFANVHGYGRAKGVKPYLLILTVGESDSGGANWRARVVYLINTSALIPNRAQSALMWSVVSPRSPFSIR